jgi:hypothetical protein
MRRKRERGDHVRSESVGNEQFEPTAGDRGADGKHIGNVNDLSFEQSSSENSSTLRFDGNVPDIVVEFRQERPGCTF